MSNEDLMVLGDIQGTMARPTSLDRNDRTGTEDITLDEVQLPRLSIAQGLSPQLVPTEGQFIKGLTIGEMFNDVTSEVYGSGPVTVIPVKRHVTRIEFDPNDRKVPLDRNVPANDPRMKWDGQNKPRATEFVEFVCLLLRPGKSPEKVIVSIKTTNKQQRQAAKLWTTFIVMREAAIYSGMYTLTTKIETGQNQKGEKTAYGVFIVRNAGFVPVDTDAGMALYNYAQQFAESLEGKVIVTDRDGGEESEAAETAGGGDTSFDPSKFDTTRM